MTLAPVLASRTSVQDADRGPSFRPLRSAVPGRPTAEAATADATARAAGHDFARVTVDQTGGPPAGGGSGSAAPPPSPTVDRIDIVTGATGATGGFAAITSGDLNTPGPWNDAATGGVSNVHQIKFHLDSGNSAALTPRRELQRSAWRAGAEAQNPPSRPLPAGVQGPPTPGGFGGVIVGPDGPAAHEVKRPTTNTIVVADAPGAASLAAAEYPFIYRSHFTVTVASGSVDIARARYDVRIEKTSATNVPNTENKVIAVEKRDLVRGRAL